MVNTKDSVFCFSVLVPNMLQFDSTVLNIHVRG